MHLGFTLAAGYAGTWGPGHNAMNNIHIKDVASAMIVMLNAALEHKADEGAEGPYFIANDASNVTWKEWQGAAGDYLLSKGINKEPGTRPFTDEFLKSLFGTDRVFYILLIFLQILGRYRIWVGGRLETNNLADRSVLEDSVGNQWRHFSTLA